MTIQYEKPFLVNVEGPDDIWEFDTMREAVDHANAMNADMADTVSAGGEHAPHMWAVPWRASTFLERFPDTSGIEAERDDMETRLSEYLCDSTGGKLSKTGYDVRTMVAHTEEYYDGLHAEDRDRAERAEAAIREVERLCDETDVETHEAIQAWLVGNIRAALTKGLTND